MKQLPVLCIIACLLTSCMGHNHNTSIAYTDNDNYYQMKAIFDADLTRDVEEYIDNKIGGRSHTSFVNTNIDGTIGLDDHTVFYMKKRPGALTIKLEKEKNSVESYERMKHLCQGLKPVLISPM